jgi:hypothetical protein
MATIQERVAELEQTATTHEAMFRLMIAIGERQQLLLEQVQRDAQQTQRLWVRLAERYGWLDDEEV